MNFIFQTCAVAAVVGATAAGLPRKITDVDIQSAVEYAERNEPPAGYALRSAFENEPPIGVVYTPFLRVALYARDVLQRGENISPSLIPKTLVEPLVYIVIRSSALSQRLDTDPSLTWGMRIVKRNAPSQSADAETPVWISRGRSSIPVQAVSAPSKDVFTAAFKLAAFAPHEDVVLFAVKSLGQQHYLASTVRGRIDPADLQQWR